MSAVFRSLTLCYSAAVARSHAGVDRNTVRKELYSLKASPAHTRAWIETAVSSASSSGRGTSPAHTRAWIETHRHPQVGTQTRVARSHAGVDRNAATVAIVDCLLVARSHAGVDRNRPYPSILVTLPCRPLTRGRGSKLMPKGLYARALIVARSHAGVDRNITTNAPNGLMRLSPAHTRAWIETQLSGRGQHPNVGRPLTRGRGSKRLFGVLVGFDGSVARSHAGVDRNTWTLPSLMSSLGSPAHTRAWIETSPGQCRCQTRTCRPLTRGRGSKLTSSVGFSSVGFCGRRPLTRGRGSKLT